MHPSIRSATPDDLLVLTQLWYDGWQVAHADHVPASLTEIRTLDSFEVRLTDNLENTRVFAPQNIPLGLCIIKKMRFIKFSSAPKPKVLGRRRP